MSLNWVIKQEKQLTKLMMLMAQVSFINVWYNFGLLKKRIDLLYSLLTRYYVKLS